MTTLWRAIRSVTGHLEFGVLTPIERARLVAHFQTRTIGQGGMRWHILDLGPRQLIAQLEWNSETLGESVAALDSPRSDFRRELQRVDPRRAYLGYFVWDDSFEVYLAARDQSNAAGFAAGWSAFGAHEPYRHNLLLPARRLQLD